MTGSTGGAGGGSGGSGGSRRGRIERDDDDRFSYIQQRLLIVNAIANIIILHTKARKPDAHPTRQRLLYCGS